MRSVLLPLVVSLATAASLSDTNATPSSVNVSVTCEQFGLTSVQVVGAPNPFCLYDTPCRIGSNAVCPPPNSYDLHGVLLTFGSCCARLDATSDALACVSRQLVASNTFQCIGETNNNDATTTTRPPPPVSDTGSGSSSHSDRPPTTRPVTTNSPTSSSTSSSGANDADGSDPDAGDEPTPTTAAPTTTPAATLSPTLEPIIETPSTTKPNSSANTPVNANGDMSSTGNGSLASAFSGNVALILVLGSVASLAVVVGAFVLRRQTGKRDGLSVQSTVPPLTPPYEDGVDDRARHTLGAFSPIRVQSAHKYTATSTPGHDRPSYFL